MSDYQGHRYVDPRAAVKAARRPVRRRQVLIVLLAVAIAAVWMTVLLELGAF